MKLSLEELSQWTKHLYWWTRGKVIDVWFACDVTTTTNLLVKQIFFKLFLCQTPVCLKVVVVLNSLTSFETASRISVKEVWPAPVNTNYVSHISVRASFQGRNCSNIFPVRVTPKVLTCSPRSSLQNPLLWCIIIYDQRKVPLKSSEDWIGFAGNYWNKTQRLVTQAKWGIPRLLFGFRAFWGKDPGHWTSVINIQGIWIKVWWLFIVHCSDAVSWSLVLC